MTKLEKWIQQCCPDDVEYKSLSELLNYEQPTKYIVKNTNYNDEYTTPVLTAGQSFILGYTNEESGIYEASKQSPVIIFDDFTTSFHWVDFSFKVKSSAMKILKSVDGNIDTFRYIYHVMRNVKYIPTEHTRQWIEKYSKFKIAVPPIEVQKEIVYILDNFTELTTELITELTARKKQYEYYRNNLLITLQNTPMMALGDVCDVLSGGTPSKKNSSYWSNGSIKWLSSTVCKNQKNVDEVTDYITKQGFEKSSAKMMKKDTTLVALVGATIGKIAFLPFEASINQNVAGIYPKDITFLNPSYVYYACTTLYPKFLALSQGKKLAMANLSFVRSLQIPVPPIKQQQKIVSILDRFDALCNDMSAGLPAEIEARKKQYEYYRNKLLTFSQK